MKPSFFVKLLLPVGVDTEEREALSAILTRVASRFSFQGLEDWQIDLEKGVKVLGVEREFHDLVGKGKISQEMRAYFGKKSDAVFFAQIIKASIEDLRVEGPLQVANKDWMKLWRKHFKTQIIKESGLAIAIVPAWKPLPKAKRLMKVRISPGQAFGTGTHATTRLCLKLFLRQARGFKANSLRVLDFGAGTGVLAFGAEAWARYEKKIKFKAHAVESDLVALEQGKKNARLNRSKVTFMKKMRAKTEYDLVFANVLAPVLVEFRELLCAAVARKGKIILSGILAKEMSEFLQRFPTKEFEIEGQLEEEDWAAVMLSRK